MGEEESLMKDHIKEIASRYIKIYGDSILEFNLDKFNADSIDVERVLDSCLTLPCGQTKKLVLLEHLEKYSPSSKSKIEEYCGAPSASTTLLIQWTTKLNSSIFNNPLVKSISTKGFVLKYWKLFEDKRPPWIQAEFLKEGYRIPFAAAQLLSEEGGETLADLKNEIEKLKIFCFENKEVSIEAVKEAMSFKRSHSLWSFIDSLESKNYRAAGQILEECLAEGEEPIKIIYFLAKFLRKSSDKMAPEVLKKLLRKLKQCDGLLKLGEDLEAALLEQWVSLYSRSLR